MKLFKSLRFIAYSLLIICVAGCHQHSSEKIHVTKVSNGIWELKAGKPEKFTPTLFRDSPVQDEALNKMAPVENSALCLSDLKISVRPRGTLIEIPIQKDEKLFGLGLQCKYLIQNGFRKQLQTNATDPDGKGRSHAPVPFLVSSAGYGIFINSARYIVFSIGEAQALNNVDKKKMGSKQHNLSIVDENDLYGKQSTSKPSIYIEVPVAQGIEMYVFAGPTMKEVVSRYNLFSGGGVLPSLAGLAPRYIMKADYNEARVLSMLDQIRSDDLPFSTVGLEPGWQTHAYSSTYEWNKKVFPAPDQFINKVRKKNFGIYLWEQAYIDPTSPLYGKLLPKSGNFAVWNGIVPDFADQKVSDIFADFQQKNLIAKGIDGFKLDECDGSGNLGGPFGEWQFPEFSQFPSGIDGEQMQMLLGRLYQRSVYKAFRNENKRTFSNARASYALAAPMPFVVYSDELNLADYVRYILSSGYQGILWSPETRRSETLEEYSTRVGIMTFAAQMVYNAWAFENFPWLQPVKEKNNLGELLKDPKPYIDIVRGFNKLRMSLLPYLYTTFYKYHTEGVAPVRPLSMDFSDDQKTWEIDDQWMFGEDILVAPVLKDNAIKQNNARMVYLPKGIWYDFWNGKKYTGAQSYPIESAVGRLPVFVKENTIIPMAKPQSYVNSKSIFEITPVVFGDHPGSSLLIEDDGETFNFEKGEYNVIELTKKGNIVENSKIKEGYPASRYRFNQSISGEYGMETLTNLR